MVIIPSAFSDANYTRSFIFLLHWVNFHLSPLFHLGLQGALFFFSWASRGSSAKGD
jgi:hypothetical protein